MELDYFTGRDHLYIITATNKEHGKKGLPVNFMGDLLDTQTLSLGITEDFTRREGVETIVNPSTGKCRLNGTTATRDIYTGKQDCSKPHTEKKYTIRKNRLKVEHLTQESQQIGERC